MKSIGKILPVEGYYVKLKGSPPINYAIALTHLYQPLIGIEAISLYQTLLHESVVHSNAILQTHHTLMNYLNMPLDILYEARLKLEGIGLLQTYENNEEQKKYYTYLLQNPYSPKEFLNDPMLSELLYHHIGSEKFNTLKNHFNNNEKTLYGKNITASFSDVFQTFQPSFDHKFQPNETEEQVDQTYHIDFEWIKVILKQRMIPAKKVLTAKNKKLISDMMFLYDLTTNEIEKTLLWSLTDENSLDEEEFKLACHDIFKTKNNKKPIQLILNRQPTNEQQDKQKPKTKEDILIDRLEMISPKQLLEDLSSGQQASEQDMKIIREVMTNQGLPAPVMNVLIHYVLLQSNMQLSKAYLEKIASHWSRANLKTAREAMEFARKQVTNYKKRSNNRHAYQKRQQSTEVIPDWFLARNKKQSEPDPKENSPQAEKKKEELAALIQQLAEE